MTFKKMNPIQEIPIKSFCVSVFVCRETSNSMDVLLIKRSDDYLGGTWQMVSGMLESSESAVDAALRELREETGIVPDRFYSANHLQQFYEVSQNCINLVPVFVAFLDSDRAVALSSEHLDFMWVPYDQVSDHVCFPDQADSARYIFEHFVEKEPLEFLRIDICNTQSTLPKKVNGSSS